MRQEQMLQDFWHSLRLFLYASRRELSFARRHFDNALYLARRIGMALGTFFLALETSNEAIAYSYV